MHRSLEAVLVGVASFSFRFFGLRSERLPTQRKQKITCAKEIACLLRGLVVVGVASASFRFFVERQRRFGLRSESVSIKEKRNKCDMLAQCSMAARQSSSCSFGACAFALPSCVFGEACARSRVLSTC